MTHEIIKSDLNIDRSRTDIERTDDLIAKIAEKYNRFYRIGQLIFDKYHGYSRLIDITYNPGKDDTEMNDRNIFIVLQGDCYKGSHNRNGIKKQSLSEFTQYNSSYPVDADSPEDFEKDVQALADNRVTLDELAAAAYPNSGASNDTGIMIMNKDVLIHKRNELIQKQQFMQARAASARELLEQRMRGLQEYAGKVREFVQKLNRLIWSIELYLGINEDLHQIQIGAPADPNEPICFRQRRLYMDEEVGDPGDDLRGMDFTNIETFDNWLLADNKYWKMKHYEMMIPEKKGVVIFRVRRNEKDYDPNPFVNAQLNKENFKTYVLIRNGDNIYRIYADITIDSKLFPDQQELENLVAIMNGEEYKPDPTAWRQPTAKDAEETLERYKLNMILFQGIIERTPCFPENSTNTSIFKPHEYEGKIKFVYDATLATQLPTNTPTFEEWKKALNSDISEGSRVYIYGAPNDKYERKQRLFKVYYSNEYNLPSAPGQGLYQVFKEMVKGYRDEVPREQLYIKYNPKDEVAWSWSDYNNYREDRTRKNNLSYGIYPSDTFLFNWDKISRRDLELLEFYMHTRIGRSAYLKYIPMLNLLFKAKSEEMKAEDDFIRLTLTRAGFDPVADFDKGVDAMEWWKLKNKWKRALTADDAKALRMIENYLKKGGK